MRKVFLFMATSVDGYFEAPGQSIDWHNVDEEFNDFAIAQLDEIGTLLFGRVTYGGMASWWTSDFAKQTDPDVTGRMNAMQKFVFSKTLDKADWENTELIKDNVAEKVKELKAQDGKDIAIFGSSDLVVSLTEAGLVDEFRILVNPIVLGAGKPVFQGIHERLKLKLINTKVFRNGNVLLSYEPIA